MLPGELFLGIHMYGLMIGIGVLMCFLVLYIGCKRLGISDAFYNFTFYNGIVAIAVGFFASALFQSFYNYLENPALGFHLAENYTFIGGLMGGFASFLIGYWIFRKKFTENLMHLMPIAPCCITIAHAFGRLGCFFGGCCYGKPTDSIFGIQFPGLDTKVFPTQLFESVFLFLLFAVCFYFMYRKKSCYTLPIYLAAYGVFRFCIEFLRGDDRGSFIGVLSPSQFWSIVMVLAAVGVVFFIRYWQNKHPQTLQTQSVEGAALPSHSDVSHEADEFIAGEEKSSPSFEVERNEEKKNDKEN